MNLFDIELEGKNIIRVYTLVFYYVLILSEL